MTSETHRILPADKAEWERAERAVVHLIAARHNLTRDGGDMEDAAGSVHADAPVTPAAIAAAPELQPAAPAPEPSAQQSRPRWLIVTLLAVVWIPVALVMYAAILSVTKLL